MTTVTQTAVPIEEVPGIEEATAAITQECMQKNSYPMWKVNDKISKLVPNPKALPTAWRWEEMKKLMLDSAQYVPEEQAERRALMLVNPGFGEVKGPSPYTTDTIYAGFQLVMPGETAPAHRHIAFAVRFIQESDKGFTSVAGQKIYLEHGDLVLTPSWQWHYHGNDGPTPTFWVDCLDIPLHVYARTNFLEPYPTAKVPDLVTDDSPFHFPWKTTQQALDAQDSPRAVYHYLSNGSPFSRTIAAQAERIKQGHTARLPRETCSFIYVVRKGSGYTKIDAPTGQKTIEWKEKDVFVVPSWSWVTHTADDAGDAYLFALTDRSLSDNLGLARVDYSAP